VGGVHSMLLLCGVVAGLSTGKLYALLLVEGQTH